MRKLIVSAHMSLDGLDSCGRIMAFRQELPNYIIRFAIRL